MVVSPHSSSMTNVSLQKFIIEQPGQSEGGYRKPALFIEEALFICGGIAEFNLHWDLRAWVAVMEEAAFFGGHRVRVQSRCQMGGVEGL